MNEFIIPYNGRVRLNSCYGFRNFNGKDEFHTGLDLIGLDDKTIIAPCDGVVKSSTMITDKNNITWQWGNYVRIDNDKYSIYLCHLSRRFVEKGEIVAKGTNIGIEGDTGYAFGSHLHLEVRKNNIDIDPSEIFPLKNALGVYSNPNILDEIAHDWSREAVQFALENELIKGYGDGENDYRLGNNITREELLVILHRFYKNCI